MPMNYKAKHRPSAQSTAAMTFMTTMPAVLDKCLLQVSNTTLTLIARARRWQAEDVNCPDPQKTPGLPQSTSKAHLSICQLTIHAPGSLQNHGAL